MRKKGTFLLLLCFFLFAGWDGFAVAKANDYSNDPGDVNTVNNDHDTQQVPIDGGLVFLLAAGAGYGLKKYRSAALQKKEQ
jgi:hypothetical protein